MSTHLTGAIGFEPPAAPVEPIVPAFAFADYDIPPSLTSEESLALKSGFALSAQEPPSSPVDRACDFSRHDEEPVHELRGPYDPAIESIQESPVPSPEIAKGVAQSSAAAQAFHLRVEDQIVPRGDTQVVTVDERDAQMARLSERIAYYEAFDSLIHDNISRSADLFKSVFEERERVRLEAEAYRLELEAGATLEAQRTLVTARESFQSTLMFLMDDANGMQRQIDGLIQRISDAIKESNSRPSQHPEQAVERLTA